VKQMTRSSRALTVLAAAAIVLSLVLVPTLAHAGDCGPTNESGRFADLLARHGAVVAIAAAFGAGFLASLTPCVYPMVPITVSVFGASSAATSRLRAVGLSGAFVLGIATLFTPLGVVSALTGKLLGSALASTWVVVSLALLFAALAASMFGAFELALPASVTNRLSAVGGVGYRGAFAMGLVMGLIAAPCTGPFLTGVVTVIATTKNVALGSGALFAFSMGLGVVFFVAGAFGASLPKSGAWMVGIKWVSGVALAYLAFSYLRDHFAAVRSLVEHPSRSFGVAAFTTLALGSLLGIGHVVAERRRSPIAHLSRRLRLASIAPAVAGAAMVFTWIGLDHDVDPSEPPIAWMTDEDAAFAKARAEGKPLVVDIGAEWCPGCRELDRLTFSNAAVRKASRSWVALRIFGGPDDDMADAMKKFELAGIPTILFFDASGRETSRINREVHADEMVALLRCHGTKRVAFASR
jgi:thioredoxin:protein disulfide reductase